MRVSKNKLNEVDREYVDAWEKHAKENPEWAAEAAKLGIFGPAVDLDVSDNPNRISDDEFDFDRIKSNIRECGFLDDEEEHEEVSSSSSIPKQAYEMAVEFITQALQAITRSKNPILRRQAETLILATNQRASEYKSEADLARAYKTTRAAVSRDIAHIREFGSFGVVTDKLFANKEKRAQDSIRAKSDWKEQKKKNKKPPQGSLAEFINKKLEETK